MSERLNTPNEEYERERGLAALVEAYFPDDKEFVMEMDFEGAILFVYGQLEAEGEDAELILHEFGVTEVNDEV